MYDNRLFDLKIDPLFDVVSRRKFIAESCMRAGGLVFGIYTVSGISGCSKKAPTEPEEGGGTGGGGMPVTITVDISLKENEALRTVGGTLALDGNALDSQGIFVVRTSETSVSAFSRTCTHQGCKVGAFSNGIATCPCHGSTFSINGKVAGGPAPSALKEYTAKLEGNTITISG